MIAKIDVPTAIVLSLSISGAILFLSLNFATAAISVRPSSRVHWIVASTNGGWCTDGHRTWLAPQIKAPTNYLCYAKDAR